ncbi:MAG: DNA primase [Pseudonocardiales bacterium]|nr:MAG: DNA primase [Pseudonocardiales bacterium]
MPGRIPDSDIAAVRERADIADVVGEHVSLRRAGGDSMKGLCPFHEERTPSFHVTPSRGTFHCFGCGAGGDVIEFVRRMDTLGFVEAVEWLAGRYGVTINYEGGGAAPNRRAGERARLTQANSAAEAFYSECLLADDGTGARAFLAERGFDAGVAEHFGCGFAPAGWDRLSKHLLRMGFSDRELMIAGLSSRAQSGSLIDKFRGRLTWPIRSVSGDIVGFGARKLSTDPHDDSPKYLNTSETPLYKKSEVLYGVDLAKREIGRARQVVVVEGYTDVMACHLAGVPTAVATCGTAFGVSHIGILRRLLMDSDEFRGEVIFTFDGDAAGQKAALRAFDDEQRFVAQTFVAVEPAGLDPCELRQQHGDAAVRDLIARREPLVAFALRSTVARYDLETVEGRVQALRAAAPLVAKIKDQAMRPEYARKLAGDLGMEVEAVVGAVRAAGGAAPRVAQTPSRRTDTDRPRADDPALGIEREMLKLAVQQPALCGPFFDVIGTEAYTHPAYAAIRAAIEGAGGTGSATAGPVWVERVRERCGDETGRSVVTELAVERLRSAGPADSRYVREHIARLQERAVDRKVAALKSTLQRINPVDEPERHTKIFGELIALEQYRRGLREQAMGDGLREQAMGDGLREQAMGGEALA